jgi:hypothetical protein
MPHRSPLWPAQLDHIRLDSDDAASLAGFYCDALGFADAAQPDGTHLLQAPARRIVIGPGELEIAPDAVQKRSWPHEERTLNLWGPGFMRS